MIRIYLNFDKKSMITKVVISAAGQGTRMLELSKDTSKHLILVNNRPFLAYLLDNILEAGYTEIILVVGYKQDKMREFVENYKLDHQCNINMVSQFEILGPKEKEYGTACPLKCVRDLVGQSNFISLVGDNFYSARDLKSMNIDDKFNYVAGIKNDHPEKFGVLIVQGEFLKEIVEKPGREFWQSQKLSRPETEFVGNLINTSLYKFTPEVFEKLPLIEKSKRGEYEITDVISLLAKDEKVKVKILKDDWMDFGRPEDLEKFSGFIK
ncbi:MAG: NTP transferase domain-containing protein [Candidatus Staskawiczbacteria bacterium]|nr:NTP transferase domain-containing protein [Candidatus Staskawiczbacteria bacterium]MBI3337464.1 NTP transferase domain-containing protein [Candidatus Staskawiczbacteria bacterium]